MPFQSFTNSLIATSSGMIGGLAKAVTSGFTLSGITIPHVIEVSVYAAISAFVGYVIKLGVDSIRARIITNLKNKQR